MRLVSITAFLAVSVHSAPAIDVSYATPGPTVPVFAPAEFVAKVGGWPATSNPFTDMVLTGEVKRPDGSKYTIRGFVDAADGSTAVFRVMPTAPGKYTVTLKTGDATGAVTGTTTFIATTSKNPGPVRVDPAHPHHFVREGSGEHWFWNGTTTYWLLGVRDEKRIFAAIDRLAANKITRIRLAINARTKDGSRWFEPQVVNGEHFQFRVNPWPAKTPDDYKNPQFDTTRFDVGFWQKLDRVVAHANAKNVIVSVIFFLDGQDPGVDPFNGGKKTAEFHPDEQRYYEYAAARLSAYPNVMWDLTNEWHLFRTTAWVDKAGACLRAADPYAHLMTVHGRGDYPFYKSSWNDLSLYQVWDESGSYAFLRKARDLAAKAGKPQPQVNEEYGYEDHYPGPWGGGRKSPARVADNRRRLAWDMTMAGGYQTTGERANEPGQGGWITGLGNDAMVLPKSQSHLVTFFTSFDWWAHDPLDGAATDGARVLADKEKNLLAVYLPKGGHSTLDVMQPVTVKWFDPRTGEWKPPVRVTASPVVLTAPDGNDWAAIVKKE